MRLMLDAEQNREQRDVLNHVAFVEAVGVLRAEVGALGVFCEALKMQGGEVYLRDSFPSFDLSTVVDDIGYLQDAIEQGTVKLRFNGREYLASQNINKGPDRFVWTLAVGFGNDPDELILPEDFWTHWQNSQNNGLGTKIDVLSFLVGSGRLVRRLVELRAERGGWLDEVDQPELLRIISEVKQGQQDGFAQFYGFYLYLKAQRRIAVMN